MNILMGLILFLFAFIKLSAPIPAQTVGRVQEAIDDCAILGARLYQPRSTAALSYFKNAEVFHMGMYGLFFGLPFKSHITLGLEYRTASGINTKDSALYYRFEFKSLLRITSKCCYNIN